MPTSCVSHLLCTGRRHAMCFVRWWWWFSNGYKTPLLFGVCGRKWAEDDRGEIKGSHNPGDAGIFNKPPLLVQLALLASCTSSNVIHGSMTGPWRMRKRRGSKISGQSRTQEREIVTEYGESCNCRCGKSGEGTLLKMCDKCAACASLSNISPYLAKILGEITRLLHDAFPAYILLLYWTLRPSKTCNGTNSHANTLYFESKVQWAALLYYLLTMLIDWTVS